ncbi:MAG TPA: thiamine pyrophosphate-dependent dehydrogenase E1 component subunit alpha [Gammaproteobacteria bacterium]|nr:thiamine pyrophosphate-dependent dehydrogenase E1 component subunit alpha [Gammaproteobacteria bacterium]
MQKTPFIVKSKTKSIQDAARTVAQFDIKYVQYVDAEGQIVNELPGFTQDSSLMLSLYRAMKVSQVLEHKVSVLHRTGKFGTYPGCLGQEAVGAGAASCLTDQDMFVPYYRSAPELYMRGVKLHEILMYWGGFEEGSNFKDPRCRFDLPIPICISSQLPHAAGVATAIKLRKQKNRAVLTFVGDGGTSEGDFYETVNAAGAWNLPLVIIINNNRWALSEPNNKQTSCQTLAQKAIAGGIEGIQVDGNDVIAVRAVTEAAMQKARQGGGATLIEALTYRLCAHTTVDDLTRYVDKSEHEQALRQEPFRRLKKLLRDNGILDEDLERKIEQEIKQEVEAEVEIFLNAPLPPPEAMFDYLYAELPERLREQRDEAIRRGDE